MIRRRPSPGVLVALSGAALALLAVSVAALLVPPSPRVTDLPAPPANPPPPPGLEAWALESRFPLPPGLGAQALAWGPEGLVVLGVASAAVFRPGAEIGPVRTVSVDFPPLALAVDGGGVWYLSTGPGVRAYGTDGRETFRWTVPGTGALVLGLAVGGGRLYAADGGQRRVWWYDLTTGAQGSLVPPEGQGFVVPGPQFPLAVRDGELVVSNPGRHGLLVFSASGVLRESWLNAGTGWDGFQGCCNPVAVALVARPSGPPWVATGEKGATRVKLLDPRGRLGAVIEDTADWSPGTGALGLAGDQDGRLYVLDPEKQEIRVHGRRGG